MPQGQMSLLPVPDDWESNDAELKLGGALGMHPDMLSQFNLGDRIEITVVAVIDSAGFKEKTVQGVDINTIMRGSKLEAGGRIRRAAKDTSVFKDVPHPDSLDAAMTSQSTADALADAAMGAVGEGIDSVEVTTSSGAKASRSRKGKPPTEPAAEPPAEPAAAAEPAAPAEGDDEPLTELQTTVLQVLAGSPGADLEQFTKLLSAANGGTHDQTEAKGLLDLLIRRGLVLLTEHNDYDLTPSGEAAIVG